MTQKRYTEIPKRQKCINKEHPYDCGAVDVYDDDLQKPQSQININRIADINSEVQRAKDVESSLQNQVNALDSQNYVSYTASDGDTLADILPPTGEADTIYRVGKWDGTQYEPTCYSEYAWHDNQYKLMDVKHYDIDEEPVENSHKLVESDGIKKQINSLFKDNIDFTSVGITEDMFMIVPGLIIMMVQLLSGSI